MVGDRRLRSRPALRSRPSAPGRRPAARAAAVLAFAAALATSGTAAAHDGAFADYRWADGSDASAEGRDAALPAGQPTELWTPDLQAVLSLPAEALTGAADTTVPAGLQPVDPATLGPLPDGLVPASNAYRVDLELAASGSILLAAAHPVTALLRSTDGEVWERTPHQAGSNGMVSAPLPTPGLYLVATDARHGGDARWSSAVPAAIGAVLLAFWWRRRAASTTA